MLHTQGSSEAGKSEIGPFTGAMPHESHPIPTNNVGSLTGEKILTTFGAIY